MMQSEIVWYRLRAMIIKEFIQMVRDYHTFTMLIIIPISQVILLGLLINSDPKHLPTVVIDEDNTPLTREFIQGIVNTDYFRIIKSNITLNEADAMLKKGEVKFVFNIPPYFSHNLIRNKYPYIFVEADSSDPIAVVNPINAAQEFSNTAFNDEIRHGLNLPIINTSNFNLIVHPKYNPEFLTRYHSVPGLIGVVLTMTMVMITSISITRDRETGAMEILLTTPVTALEVILGKLIPYIIVGYIVFSLNLFATNVLFHVPFEGSLITMYIVTLPFIISNLAVGITISTIALNQFQAVQMSTFFLLPTIILSGFLFPFEGMPVWAQNIGELIPLTHYLKLLRGIMLKGLSLTETWPDMWPILLFTLVIIVIGLIRYRKTLD